MERETRGARKEAIISGHSVLWPSEIVTRFFFQSSEEVVEARNFQSKEH